MPERLVDVLRFGTVIHTFPVLIENPQVPADDDFVTSALKLAANLKLVPDDDFRNLNARMHVPRGGQVTPYGDGRHILEGTKQGLEHVLRERAYFLWENEGCPPGQAEDHWYRAFDQHLRERAYFLWLSEDCPEGRAEEHWSRAYAFETYPLEVAGSCSSL